jgi:hypothetical protein
LPAIATSMPPTGGELRELLERGPPLQDVDLIDPCYSPWFLQSSCYQNEILFHLDGSVKGGTIQALVVRLTANDYAG